MDFQHDLTASGKRLRTLSIGYDRPLELYGGSTVGHGLHRASFPMCYGPEMIGKAVDEWACRNSVRLNYIEPGKPVQNALSSVSTRGSAMNASMSTGSCTSPTPVGSMKLGGSTVIATGLTWPWATQHLMNSRHLTNGMPLVR